MRMKRPTVTMTTAITECWIGRITITWMVTPSTKAITSVRKNASQYETPQIVS